MSFYASLDYSQWVNLSFAQPHSPSIILSQICYSLMCLISSTNPTEKMLHNEKFERCLDFFHNEFVPSSVLLDNFDKENSEEQNEESQHNYSPFLHQKINAFSSQFFSSEPLIENSLKEIIDSFRVKKDKVNLVSILEFFCNTPFQNELIPFPPSCTLSIFTNYARYVLVKVFEEYVQESTSITTAQYINKLHYLVIEMLKKELEDYKLLHPQQVAYAELVYNSLIGLCYNEIGFNLISFLNDKKNALHCFHQSVLYDIYNPLYISNRGRTLITLEKLNSGLQDLKKCLEMDPTFCTIHKSLGYIYMNPLISSKQDSLIHFQIFLDWQNKIQIKQSHLSTLSFTEKSQLPLLERYYEYMKLDSHVPEMLHAMALLFRSQDEMYLSLRTLLEARELSMMVFLREGIFHWEKEYDLDSAAEVLQYFC